MLPKIISTGEIYNVVIIDGIYVTKKTVLIAMTPNFVIDY
jgi:hypothetical protein